VKFFNINKANEQKLTASLISTGETLDLHDILSSGIQMPIKIDSLEDCSSRPAQANSSQDPISKKTTRKWTRGMAQAVEHLLCKCKVLSSNPSLTKNIK
jgi:hypothetical protein